MDNERAEDPQLSIVVAARNDDYGGNFLLRMQSFLNNVDELGKRFGLDFELLIVEWNPPQDRAGLQEALTLPSYIADGRIRFFEVPAEMHNRFPNADRVSLFEYIAKNVGIRRARGQFILATNPDILYSEALFKFLASSLQKGSFYRVDRYDVPLAPSVSVAQQISFCRKRWFQAHTRYGRIIRYRRKYWFWLLHTWFRRWGGTSFTPERVLERAQLHTRTAGDFLLMARDHWHLLRGFPEFFTYAHIDAFMCAQAAAAGLTQVVLPAPLVMYHQEHGRSENAGRPMTDLDRFITDCDAMLKGEKEYVYNDEQWGLATHSLPGIY